MKSMNDNINATFAKLNDKYEKKIETQLQPMSVKTTDISSKKSKNVQNEVLNITSDHPSS